MEAAADHCSQGQNAAAETLRTRVMSCGWLGFRFVVLSVALSSLVSQAVNHAA